MNITFILPTAGVRPIGGYKVVYEYANHLVARNHSVRVVHPALYDKKASVSERLKSWLRYLYRKGTDYGPKNWFDIDQRVELLWVPSLDSRYIPPADVVIATAWQTAEWVALYPKSRGEKLQIVYDYEHYKAASPELRQRIVRALKSEITKIATSPSVVEMLTEITPHTKPHYYVSNGIDLETFQLRNSIETERKSIGFPSRSELFKGTEDAVKALSIVYPALERKGYSVWSFGGQRPTYLPAWVNHYQRPSDSQLCQLYNQTAIFVVPSHYEGWGLPGAESMACGAALVSTDNGGVRAYAEHQTTAILCSPKAPEEIAKSVQMLLDNEGLRQRIARAGYEHIQSFTWENAVDELENVLLTEASQQGIG